LQPEWSQAARNLQPHGITLAKVDCTQNPGLSQQFKIEGFPTIIYFSKGKQLENYTSHRDAQSITNWLSEKKGVTKVEDSSVIVLDDSNFDSVIA